MGATRNLVLGGSGTIGAALCRLLEERGESVINLDLRNGFDLRSDDLSPYKEVDYVWFLAWDVGGAKYLTNRENFYKILNNNTLITQRTFSFLKAYSLPFMFTSSQLATADNIYGLTKLMGEEWTKLLEGQLVKLWNVYGWEEPGEKSHVITDMVMKGLTTGKIDLLTTGEEERQFIYMDDCILNMLDIRSEGAKDVDLTDHRWVRIIDVAKLVGTKLGAVIVPGPKEGYSNKIQGKKNFPLTFRYSLDAGLDLVISQAKAYLQRTRV